MHAELAREHVALIDHGDRGKRADEKCSQRDRKVEAAGPPLVVVHRGIPGASTVNNRITESAAAMIHSGDRIGLTTTSRTLGRCARIEYAIQAIGMFPPNDAAA